jgi:hypothetical protein
MKKIALCVTVLLFSAAAFSQKGVGTELGFGVDFGVPVGNFGLNANPGIGGDAKLGYNFTPNWALLLQAGYIAFFTTQKLNDRNIGTIGDGFFKVSGRYVTKGRLYFEPGFGFSKFSTSNIKTVGGSGFTYAGAVGLYADKAKTFDFSVRYEATVNSESIHFVGLRFGYRFVSGHSF